MDWTNPIDSAKSTQSNPKKWVGSDNWVNMGLKNKNSHTKIGFRTKLDPTKKSTKRNFELSFKPTNTLRESIFFMFSIRQLPLNRFRNFVVVCTNSML
jgi:hypothetical protein